MSLSEMAAKGRRKLEGKQQQMITSYNNAKSRMKAHYQGKGFGPTRTANYGSAIDRALYPGSNPSRWEANWVAKMGE